MRTLVVIATYNEIENLPRLVETILSLPDDLDVLVIDDNSPDGTGHWVRQQSDQEPRLDLIERTGKLGLGTATFTGLRYAIEQRYDCAVTMDADFSHHPPVHSQTCCRIIGPTRPDPGCRDRLALCTRGQNSRLATLSPLAKLGCQSLRPAVLAVAGCGLQRRLSMLPTHGTPECGLGAHALLWLLLP